MNIYEPKPQLGGLDRKPKEPFIRRALMTKLNAVKTHDGTVVKIMTAQYAGDNFPGAAVKAIYDEAMSEAGNHNAIAMAVLGGAKGNWASGHAGDNTRYYVEIYGPGFVLGSRENG